MFMGYHVCSCSALLIKVSIYQYYNISIESFITRKRPVQFGRGVCARLRSGNLGQAGVANLPVQIRTLMLKTHRKRIPPETTRDNERGESNPISISQSINEKVYN